MPELNRFGDRKAKDAAKKVPYRLRERQPAASFWLPTSIDRFYPDFVAELEDGRLFAMESKGGDRYSNDDSNREARHRHGVGCGQR